MVSRHASMLSEVLRDPAHQSVQKLGAVATAIGFIGDRRTITPLTAALFDAKLTALSRAFAAAALGSIADKELLQWSALSATNGYL